MVTPQRLYRIGASNFYGTYDAGEYVAGSEAEAIEMAREAYRRSEAGRTMKDTGAFRFYVKRGTS